MSTHNLPGRRAFCQRVLLLGAVFLAALQSVSVFAANGTWVQDNSGNWSNGSNWLNTIIADGAGSAADFSTIDITTARTVTLDTSRSIGSLKFQDAINGNNDWILANSGGAILTLDNGASQPVVDVLNRTLTISAPLAGTNGFRKTSAGALVLSGANTGLSGNIRLERGNMTVLNSNAFGTGTVVIDPGSAVNAQMILTTGINLANNVTINSSNAGAGVTGSIITNGAFDATISGTVTINGVAASGGHIAGSTGTNYLNFTGQIIDTLAPNFVGGGTGNGIVVRGGNIRLSGGGSYFRIDERAGTLAVGANNGIATNAVVNLGGNGNSTLDLAGFNQTIVAVSALINNTTNTVTNSSTTTASTLTLAPNASNFSVPQYTNIAFGGVIQDASAAAPLNIAINGAPTGLQTFSNAANTYRGSTTLTSGTLAVGTLANGGVNSSIGASSNAAANLVFNGGVLQYTGTTVSTDRSFMINAAKSGTINVSTAGQSLTISGASAPTNGGFFKAGPGTLILTGANLHTGTTTVSAGTLLVNGTGSLAAGSAVSVANGATLGGNSTINGTVTPLSGGIIAPGNNAVGPLSIGALTLNTGAFVNFEFGSGNDQISVLNAGGLALNGGNVNLFAESTTNPFSTNGIYTLFNINGGFSGAPGNLTVTNPVAGKSYNLASTATAIQLTIGDATTREWNNNLGTGIWSSGGNWIGGTFPNSSSESAKFGSATGAAPVDLNGSKTVSGLTFDNFGSYTLTGTASTLNLNNGVAATAISVVNGNHTIAVPISQANTTAITFSNNSGLTLSGALNGGRALTVSGSGTLTTTANNSFSTTALSGATLNVGSFGGFDTAGSLGTGNATLSGGATLNFNRSNSYSFAGGISGAGSINQLGNGTTTIAGVISGINTLNVSAGSLIASNSVDQTGGVTVSGSGSLSVAGSLTGAGAVSMSSSGTLTLGGSNTYNGGTTISSGTVILNNASALPTNSVLAVNGGTLDLNGNNISLSNILDIGSGGIITNNGPAASTSTVSFSGFQANYNLYAALNDGASGGKVALITGIDNTATGAVYRLVFHSPSTYSGGTTVTKQSIEADATNAFGTGPITVALNNSSINTSQIFLTGGVSIPNNITIAQGNPGTGNGVIQQIATTAGSTTVSGTITIQADNVSGGLFVGPTAVGDFLNLTGAVNTAGTATTISQRAGNVKYSGGGSYPNIQITGNAQLGAPNGLSQSAIVQLGPSGAATLDLGGFDQTMVGLSATTANATVVQNTGAGPNNLTINTTGTNNFNGQINENPFSPGTGIVNLTVAGTGTQQLTGASSGYTGTTTIGGTATLEASVLANGSALSSIGAASNAASNLVFDGGTLRYVGATTSTDRGFTINAGKTAKIDVATAATNLTWSGSSGASNGGLTKLGLGTLTIDAAATHGFTGATTVSAGRLIVNNNLSSTSSVSVAAGAFLAGSGTIGGTANAIAGTVNPGAIGSVSAGTITFSGPLTLNGGTYQYDVDGANLASPALQDLVKANGGLTITSPTTIDLEFLNPGSPPGAAYDYTLFNYTGTAPSGASLSNLSFITNVAGRNIYTPTATGGQVKVHVVPGASANLVWNGTSSGVWDVNTTANWLNGAAADKFQNGDNASFTDAAGVQTAITLNTTVSPNSVTVTSNTNAYTISGTGKISGLGTLTKNGASTLTLKTNNDYSGNTTIGGGVVNVGGGTGSGSLGTGNVTNNASLIFSRTDGNAIIPLVIPNTISGTGNLTLNLNGTANFTANTINQASITAIGLGTANLAGTITTTGNVSVSSGTVNVTATGSLNAGGNIAVSGNSALNVTGSTTATSGITTSGAGNVNLAGGFNGPAGITQGSTGAFVIAGGSSYDGPTLINSGVFFPNSPSAFGSTTNPTTVNAGGEIYATTANTNYGTEAITINGNATGAAGDGAIRVGGATTSTFDGAVTVGSNSQIGLDGGATLRLSTGITGSNVQLTLSGGGTLSLGGNANLGATGAFNTGTTASILTLAPGSATTATLSSPVTGAGSVNFGPTDSSTLNVAATVSSTGAKTFNPGATSTVNVSTPITSTAGNVTITTSDTVSHSGVTKFLTNNTYVGTTNIGDGFLVIGTDNALGAATNVVAIQSPGNNTGIINGTLQLAPTTTGITVPNPITLSARQVPNNLPAIQNIQGNNTMTGNISTAAGGSDFILASEGGVLTMQGTFIPVAVTGPRNLVLQGAGYGAFAGSITNGSAVISVVKNGTGTWSLSSAKTYTGNTTVNGGTLLLGAANAISTTSSVVLNGGTLGTGGFAQNMTPAQLNVSLNSTLDLGNGAGTVNFADSSSFSSWGGNLTVTHWSTGADHLVFGNTSAALSATQLSQITFATYSSPAIISGTGEVTPGSLARTLLKGDFSMNGFIDPTDVPEGLKALTNLAAFQANNGLDPGQLLTVADVDSNGSVSNRDIQPLLNLVASFGFGSVAAVPEPSTMVLLALGGVTLLATRYRKQRS